MKRSIPAAVVADHGAVATQPGNLVYAAAPGGVPVAQATPAVVADHGAAVTQPGNLVYAAAPGGVPVPQAKATPLVAAFSIPQPIAAASWVVNDRKSAPPAAAIDLKVDSKSAVGQRTVIKDKDDVMRSILASEDVSLITSIEELLSKDKNYYVSIVCKDVPTLAKTIDTLKNIFPRVAQGDMTHDGKRTVKISGCGLEQFYATLTSLVIAKFILSDHPDAKKQAAGYRLAMFSITAPPADPAKEVHVQFKIDISGSMDKNNRLFTAKRAARQLIHKLEKLGIKVRYTLIVYNAVPELIAHAESADSIRKKIMELKTKGGTNLFAAQVTAAETIKATDFGSTTSIDIGDGEHTEGGTLVASLEQAKKIHKGNLVPSIVIGVGKGHTPAEFKEIAAQTNGFYAFVEDSAQLAIVLPVLASLVVPREPILDAKLVTPNNPQGKALERITYVPCGAAANQTFEISPAEYKDYLNGSFEFSYGMASPQKVMVKAVVAGASDPAAINSYFTAKLNKILDERVDKNTISSADRAKIKVLLAELPKRETNDFYCVLRDQLNTYLTADLNTNQIAQAQSIAQFNQISPVATSGASTAVTAATSHANSTPVVAVKVNRNLHGASSLGTDQKSIASSSGALSTSLSTSGSSQQKNTAMLQLAQTDPLRFMILHLVGEHDSVDEVQISGGTNSLILTFKQVKNLTKIRNLVELYFGGDLFSATNSENTVKIAGIANNIFSSAVQGLWKLDKWSIPAAALAQVEFKDNVFTIPFSDVEALQKAAENFSRCIPDNNLNMKVVNRKYNLIINLGEKHKINGTYTDGRPVEALGELVSRLEDYVENICDQLAVLPNDIRFADSIIDNNIFKIQFSNARAVARVQAKLANYFSAEELKVVGLSLTIDLRRHLKLPIYKTEDFKLSALSLTHLVVLLKNISEIFDVNRELAQDWSIAPTNFEFLIENGFKRGFQVSFDDKKVAEAVLKKLQASLNVASANKMVIKQQDKILQIVATCERDDNRPCFVQFIEKIKELSEQVKKYHAEEEKMRKLKNMLDCRFLSYDEANDATIITFEDSAAAQSAFEKLQTLFPNDKLIMGPTNPKVVLIENNTLQEFLDIIEKHLQKPRITINNIRSSLSEKDLYDANVKTLLAAILNDDAKAVDSEIQKLVNLKKLEIFIIYVAKATQKYFVDNDEYTASVVLKHLLRNVAIRPECFTKTLHHAIREANEDNVKFLLDYGMQKGYSITPGFLQAEIANVQKLKQQGELSTDASSKRDQRFYEKADKIIALLQNQAKTVGNATSAGSGAAAKQRFFGALGKKVTAVSMESPAASGSMHVVTCRDYKR